MVFSGMLRRVALVRTDVSEERSAFIIRVTRIGELGKPLTVTSNRRALQRSTTSQHALVASYANVVPSLLILVTLMMEELRSFETSVLTRATRCNISEECILLFFLLVISHILYVSFDGKKFCEDCLNVMRNGIPVAHLKTLYYCENSFLQHQQI
jgi:hypothetical protein